MNKDYLELEGKYNDAQSLLEMLCKQSGKAADNQIAQQPAQPLQITSEEQIASKNE